MLSTDHVSTAIRHAIEAAFGCTVYNHYGMTEMGLGGGVECEARRGYHLREADLYFEIIDPATGRVLPDGECGEVAFTTLTRRGMPLIRYRTGDVSRFLTGPCPCGAHLKTLERITHRLDGRHRIGENYLTMADLDEAIFPIAGVLNFAATLARDHGRDSLHLDIQVADDVRVAPIMQAVTRAIPFRQSLDVQVSTVNALPASMAKRSIIDWRSHA